jgi:predicted RND superfamily exporter protein
MRSRFQPVVDGISNGLIRQRHLLFVIFTAITLALGWSATRVQIDPGFMKMLPLQHPYMKTMMEYLEVFPDADQLLISLRWKGKGDIYNPEFMDELRKATDDVFFIPGVDRVDVQSIFTPNVRYIEITEQGFNGDVIVPAHFTGSPADMAKVRNNVEKCPQCIGLLVSKDGKAAMIRAAINERDPQTGKVDRMLYWNVAQSLAKLRTKYTNDKIEVNIIGFPMILAAVLYGLFGVFIFFGVAFLITMAMLYVYSRSFRLTLVALTVALLPVLWLLGVLPLIGAGIDPMSILVPFLIFSIGVSHAVQMTNAWRQEVLAGASPVEASRASFRKLFVPGSVALLTNALGFAVIMFIDIPIVHELGITACIGVLLMVITNKLVLPIILTHVRLERTSIERGKRPPSAFGTWIWRRISASADPQKALWVFAAWLLVLGVTTVVSRSLVIGDTGRGAPELWPNSEVNRDIKQITSTFDIGTDVLGVIVEAKHFDGDSCLHYDVVNAVDRFETYMRGVPGVQSVLSVAGFGKMVIGAFNEGNPRWEALPRSEQALSAGSPAFEPSLGFNTESCRAIKIMVFTHDHESATVSRVTSAAEQFIAANKTPGVVFRLGSGNIGVAAATNEAVAKAEAKMLLAIFASLTILCYITFRSYTAVLSVMLPLTMVSIFCNALMARLGIGLKVATLPVVALGVGVGVDYGIYLFERIQHHMAEGVTDFREAFHRAMLERGAASVFTSLTMSMAVGTWIFSKLKFQADMGLLLSFMFLVNMIGAIGMLPALGTWFHRGQSVPQPPQGTAAAQPQAVH